jgi:hypothetical protein
MMIALEKRKKAFIELGQVLGDVSSNKLQLYLGTKLESATAELDHTIKESYHHNGWFTEEMVRHMIGALGKSLDESFVSRWLDSYSELNGAAHIPKNIAVIMAGNIPAVGFHDFLSVLISGKQLLARLSSDDELLMPAIARILTRIQPEFELMIKFKKEKLTGFDAVIATGSNNTSRYFDYYFGKYPNIIRKNRNGIAVLDGTESDSELEGLTDDIFLYYGLGCRNVSKLYVPEGYDFTALLEVAGKRKDILDHHKYFNNYEYNKAIFLINNTPHLDASNLILVENEQIASPVSVVHYEYYQDSGLLKELITVKKDEVQCIISHMNDLDNTLPFGSSQQPQLWDYADGIDTMDFLLNLE